MNGTRSSWSRYGNITAIALYMMAAIVFLENWIVVESVVVQNEQGCRFGTEQIGRTKMLSLPVQVRIAKRVIERVRETKMKESPPPSLFPAPGVRTGDYEMCPTKSSY